MANVHFSRGELEARWARLLADRSCSGLTVLAFCRRHSVPTSTFYRWKRRLSPAAPATPPVLAAGNAAPARPPLGRRRPASAPPAAPSGQAPFVPVRILDRAPVVAASPKTLLEFALRDGRPMRIATDLTAEGLAHLVAALEGAGC